MIALTLLGCTPDLPDDLDGLKVTEAHLEGVAFGSMAVIGGGWTGGGDLVATTASGQELILPVDLGAGTVGMLMEMTWAPPSKLKIDLPRKEVPVEHLFGTYTGSRESLVLLIGAVGQHLENKHGVRIDDTAFGLGVGISVGWNWMSLSPHELDTGDTGTSTHTADTSAVDTGSTTDTGAL